MNSKIITIGIHGIPNNNTNNISHDHGIAIMSSGKLLFHQELERKTGIKHDGQMIDHIDQLIDPWIKKENQIRIILVNSFLKNNFISKKNDIISFTNKLFPVKQIINKINESKYIISHEMAHIGTCLPFFGTFKKNSLLLHIDGGASQSCASVWFYDGIKIKYIYHGWNKKIKKSLNNFNDNPLSFKILNMNKKEHLSLPGKLMGFAGYGTYDNKLHKELIKNDWDISILKKFNSLKNRNIAICMQKEFENTIINFINKYKKETNAQYLYYSGGAALNIHTNTKIENTCRFKQIFIPPAPNDSGLAIGAASYLEWISGNSIKKINAFINEPIIDNYIQQPKNLLINDINIVSKLINEGEIIAIYNGKGEIGPRALGNRSLICRADSKKLKKILSEKMKKREWYRPVSPMILPKIAKISLKNLTNNSNLPKYMLGAWKINKKMKFHFEGSIHSDGTVRAQIINNKDNAHMYKLLSILKKKYKIYAIINTSFNKRGAPIVNSIKQAIKQATDMGIKYIWIPPSNKIHF